MDFRVKMKQQDPAVVAEIVKIANAVRDVPAVDDYRDAMPRALLVGGFVRDALLGIPSKDADIEVFGADAEALEDALRDLYPGNVKMVGRAFGVLKIAFHAPDSTRHEIDVSIPRRESKTGRGHRGFAVSGDPAMTYRDAARRRDFTINAISADPLSGDMIDPSGGANDVKKKILRVVDPHTFTDDPLRVYRALQFAARFDLSIEETTRALLAAMVSGDELDDLPAERIGEEWRKLLLKSARPSVGLRLGRDIGLVEKYYPEFSALEGTEQEPEWHPEGNVWIHTLMVVDDAARILRQENGSRISAREGRSKTFSEQEQWIVMLGALCHDLGKPATTKVIDGRIRSRGHSEAGLGPTDDFLDKIAASDDVRDAVRKLVNAHLYPGMMAKALANGEMTPAQYANATRKLIRRLHPTRIELLLAVAEADFRGRDYPTSGQPVFEYGAVMREVISAHRLEAHVTETLVRGADVLALGVPPGPRVGELIRAVEAARDRGEIKTREEGLALLRQMIVGD